MGRSMPEAVISRPVEFRVGGEVGALVSGGVGVGGGVGLAALLNKPPPLRKLVSGDRLDLLMAEMDDSEEMVTSTFRHQMQIRRGQTTMRRQTPCRCPELGITSMLFAVPGVFEKNETI